MPTSAPPAPPRRPKRPDGFAFVTGPKVDTEDAGVGRVVQAFAAIQEVARNYRRGVGGPKARRGCVPQQLARIRPPAEDATGIAAHTDAVHAIADDCGRGMKVVAAGCRPLDAAASGRKRLSLAGGSSGVDYLDKTTRYRVFTELWAVRTLLLPKAALPPLRNPEAYGFAESSPPSAT